MHVVFEGQCGGSACTGVWREAGVRVMSFIVVQ